MKDDLPYGGGEDVGAMVDLMVELEDLDARDTEWLPPNEQRKLAARKTGMISSTSKPKVKGLLVLREKEGPLSWPRCRCEIGMNTMTPETR
jgi:hypothetical protein